MSKALVIFSGGQDSATCLFWAMKKFDEVHALTINYGQRHSREVEAAAIVAKLAGLPAERHEKLYIADCLIGTSPLVNPSQRLEQYEDHNSLPGGLEKTFVPARNLLFLTIAANRAYCLGIPNLVMGVCQEDFGGYPDCRRTFIDNVEETLDEGMPLPGDGGEGLVDFWNIETPLMNLTKAESVKMALGIKGCYAALAFTHTAYDGAYPPTGKDHATLLRAKGFEQAGYPDPLIVRAWLEDLMPLPASDNYIAWMKDLLTVKFRCRSNMDFGAWQLAMIYLERMIVEPEKFK